LIFMDNKDSYIELVKQAQLGDKDALNRLAEVARERLSVHVYRLVLAEAATQDIVQECMIQMFKILDKLKRADRFWSWLYGIAHNKILHYRRTEWRQKKMSMTDGRYPDIQKDEQEGLESLISRELKQIVSAAMANLSIQQREVLAMRCYDEMTYSEIAESMGCSEVGAQMRFFRAKKALQKQLSRWGLGKGSLIVTLALFGKMTATSEASAANVAVTATTIKVGAMASLAAMATSKTAVISLTTTAIVAVGTVAMVPRTNINDAEQISKSMSFSGVPSQLEVNKDIEEHWYYYPPGTNGVVMMQMRFTNDDRESYCQWLQNDQANYYRRDNTIYVENCRMWANDLAVRRLPTDTPQLREFLSQVEGKAEDMKYVPSYRNGLLVVVKHDQNNNYSQFTFRSDVSDEECFRYRWPAGARVIDNRDEMHKRGWTYFTITGQINGKEVQGRGRIPFVYAVSLEHWPWLELKVGDRIVNEAGFAGIGRPWIGLHTVDTIRRDAAQKQIWFETEYKKRNGKAEVALKHKDGKIMYTINMKKDVVESIEFSGDTQGRLNFNYLQDIDNIGNEFAEPRWKSSMQGHQDMLGMLWLVRLVEG
jgi:RNA polymerase sigma-70 factor (ECF subfamily)